MADVKISALPAATALDGTESLPVVQGGVTKKATVSQLSVNHGRATTGAIGGGGSLSVTVPWSTAFADTNYTAVASVVDSTAVTASLSVVHIESLQVGSVNVRVQNTSGAPITGTVHVIGIHD